MGPRRGSNRARSAQDLGHVAQSVWRTLVVALVAASLVSFAAAAAPAARAITAFDATTYSAGANARAVATGDLNGDGLTDVVAADADSNAVSVLLGSGGGALAPATTFAAGTQPADVAIVDLNKDGSPTSSPPTRATAP